MKIFKQQRFANSMKLLLFMGLLLFVTGCSIEITTGAPQPLHQEMPDFTKQVPVDENVATDWSSPEEFLGPWTVSNQEFDTISFDSYTSEDKPHPHNGMVHLEVDGEQTTWGIWYVQNDDLHLELQDGSKMTFEKPVVTQGPKMYDDVVTFADGSTWIQK